MIYAAELFDSARLKRQVARMSDSLNRFAAEKLAIRREKGLFRQLFDTHRDGPITVKRDDRTLISFCCNDYLNLSHDARLITASHQALDMFGTGAGASRLITGNHPLLTALEDELATLKGTEAAIVFGSGYLANMGIIPALVGSGDLVLIDELAHSCLMSGTRLSGADEVRFPHNELGYVEDILKARRGDYQHVMIITDGVFSMDGDLAPVSALGELAETYDAWLMTDDAHGIGVVGDGRGSAFVNNGGKVPPLQMGTLSKAIGGYGGYLCASQDVIDLLRNRARSFVYSTGLPPASAASALAALKIVREEPDYCALPLSNAQYFCRALNLPDAQSPIVPIIIGDPDKTLAAAKALEDKGFLVTAIRPPTVPDGTARLRFTFTAQHTRAQINDLIAAVREVLG